MPKLWRIWSFCYLLFAKFISAPPVAIPLYKYSEIDPDEPALLNVLAKKYNVHLAKDTWYPNPPTPLNLNNYQNAAYYANITLGEPNPQLFTVLPDTATSDFWVPSIYCLTPACTPPAYRQYNPALSNYYHPRGRNFIATYHNGTVTGLVGQDFLRIAGYNLEQQQFGLALTINGTALENRVYDGIMGFGFPELCSTGIPPFYNLIRTGQLELPIFSFWFGPPTSNPGGILYFSGVNNDLYVPDIVWMQVISHQYWMVCLRNVQYGLDIYRDGCQALFDTSTPFIVGPKNVTDAINTSMGGVQLSNGLWRILCASIPFLPDFTVFLSPYRFDFSIPASAYTFQQGNLCYSYFIGMDVYVGRPPLLTWVLGTSFLRVWYSAYNADTGQVGLARALSF